MSRRPRDAQSNENVEDQGEDGESENLSLRALVAMMHRDNMAAARQRREDDIARADKERIDAEERQRQEARTRQEQLDMHERWRREDRQREQDLRGEAICKERASELAENLKRRAKIASLIPPVAKLIHSKDLVRFLDRFKEHMQKYQVDADQWGELLQPALDNKSAKHMDELPKEIREDFSALRKALTEFHGINECYYRQAWEEISFRDETPAMEIYQTLLSLFENWTAELTTKKELLLLVVREKFMSQLPPHVKLWVGERKPKTGLEAVELVNHYRSVRPKKEYQNKGRQDTRFRPRTERKENSEGDTTNANPPSTQGTGEKDYQKTRHCFGCGSKDHLIVNCPKNARAAPPPDIKKEVNMATPTGGSALKMMTGSLNKQQAWRMVRDTACSMSVIDESYLPVNYVVEKELPIAGLHSTNVLPITTVKLRVGRKKWRIQMAVTQLYNKDALLGNDIPGIDDYEPRLSKSTRKKPRRSPEPRIEPEEPPRSTEQAEMIDDEENRETVRSGRPTRKCKTPHSYAEDSSSESEESSIEETSQDDSDTSDTETEISTSEESDDENNNSSSDEETAEVEPEETSDGSSGETEHSGSDHPTISKARKYIQDQDEEDDEEDDEEQVQEAETAMDDTHYRQKWGLPMDLDGGRDQLRQLQREDENLEKCRRSAQNEDSKFEWNTDDELLYRRGSVPGDPDTEIWQLVLPQAYREQTLRMAHSSPLAGHFGVKRTKDRIGSRFFWPGITADIEDLCKRCQVCQKMAPKRTPRAPLVPLPTIRTPFSRLAMDIIGPLPKTDEGHRFILTICDYGTRYPEAIPLKNVTSEDIAQGLVEIMARIGIPEEILTDRGANFTSELMAQLYRLLGIRGIKTSAYHPQTDGMTERFNGTLKSGIKKFVAEYGGQWDKALPYILFAYRETPHSATGLTPFELALGTRPKGPLDILKRHWSKPQLKAKSKNVVDFMEDVYKRMHRARIIATMTEEKAKKKMKQCYDKGTKPQLFEIGDLVLILKPSSTIKLQAQWLGPYSVVEKLSPTTYKVKKLNGGGRVYTYHTNFIKRWQSPSAVCFTTVELDAPEADDLAEWEIHEAEGEVKVGDEVDEKQRIQLHQLITAFPDVFSNKVGRTPNISISIDTGDERPVYSPPYRVPAGRLPIVQDEIRQMLQEGIISPTDSPWSSPLMLVRKKDGSYRPVVDYRRLNDITKPNPFPMPRIDDMIDGLASASYISTLDLTKGYWQVPVDESSKMKTAFVSPRGKYQFNVMPFGLKGAPAVFQRLMNDLFMDMTQHVAAYIDDVVIFSSSWSEHLCHLEEVLTRLRAAGLTVKAKKCQLAMNECDFLGHKVGRGQVRPDEAKIADIMKFRRPVTKKDVRAFLGLAGYYRKIVPNFSAVAAPLSDLTKDINPHKVVWGIQEQDAFDALKKTLTSEPVLRGPRYDRTFYLQTDASDRGIAGVLSQMDDEDQENPVAYFSRKLSKSQKNYSTVDKECLAIVESVRQFQIYLTGVHFVIVTDHKCLEWLNSMKEEGGRKTRWSLRLQPFDFEIRHRPGIDNGNADGLSRQAWPDEGDDNINNDRDQRHPVEVIGDPINKLYRSGEECYDVQHHQENQHERWAGPREPPGAIQEMYGKWAGPQGLPDATEEIGGPSHNARAGRPITENK